VLGGVLERSGCKFGNSRRRLRVSPHICLAAGRSVARMHRMEWAQIYQSLAGDREDCTAWRELERRVRIWLSSDGFKEQILDDAVADVLAAVVTTFDCARGADTFRGFVLGHRFNIRRRVRCVVRAPFVRLDAVDTAFADIAERPDPTDLDRLGRALDALPDREFRAINLHYFSELGSEQVARELGVSPVNARQIVHQGLRRLRRQFALFQPSPTARPASGSPDLACAAHC
jgi:RNA polymerase sigma factor (sigma-70 family)